LRSNNAHIYQLRRDAASSMLCLVQLLLYPAPSSVSLNPCATAPADALRVFIAFDDVPAYKRALRTIAHVAQQFSDDLDVRSQPCPFDVIESDSWRTLASDEVGDSEIVVISTSHAGSLPKAIREWLQACSTLKRGSGTLLVAMLGALDRDRAPRSSDTVFLRRLAESAGWGFLSPQDGNRSLCNSS
jgi:hypothetical protein